MENKTELINLLIAIISLLVAIVSFVRLFKNDKNNVQAGRKNYVSIRNNSGTVNQYGNSYNYTDNRTHINKTQIFYSTSSNQKDSSGDSLFIICCGLLLFPFNNVLVEYQWILKVLILLLQFIILFCIYRNVRICLPSESTFINIIFFISPSLLIILSEVPSFFGSDIIDFSGAPTLAGKTFGTAIILLTYVAFLLMLSSHISSLISPKISSPKIKNFFEKNGRLWDTALFFQIMSVSLGLIVKLVILKNL